MDQVDFQLLIDSIKPDPAAMDIVSGTCCDLGVKIKPVAPYWWQLVKEGFKPIDLMTISQTTLIAGKSYMMNDISKVRKQIIEHFK